MFMRLFLVVGFAVSSYAKTPEEIKKWFMQVGMECSKEYPISPEEMIMLQNHKIPEGKNVNCLLACIYKKPKWLSDDGTFDFDKAEAMLDTELNDDAEKKANGKKLIDECRSVNDATVTDGAAGCERSHLLVKCLTENAPKFGFNLKHVRLMN